MEWYGGGAGEAVDVGQRVAAEDRGLAKYGGGGGGNINTASSMKKKH